jgi:hypothetical protein
LASVGVPHARLGDMRGNPECDCHIMDFFGCVFCDFAKKTIHFLENSVQGQQCFVAERGIS